MHELVDSKSKKVFFYIWKYVFLSKGSADIFDAFEETKQPLNDKTSLPETSEKSSSQNTRTENKEEH